MAETRRLVIEVEPEGDELYWRRAKRAVKAFGLAEGEDYDLGQKGEGWSWRWDEATDATWKARFEAEQREHAEEWGRRLELERRLAESSAPLQIHVNTTEPILRHSLVDPCEAAKCPLEQDAATTVIDDITCPDCLRIWGRSKVDERHDRIFQRSKEIVHGESRGRRCVGLTGGSSADLANVNCPDCLRKLVYTLSEATHEGVQLFPSHLDTLRALHADALAAQRVALQSRRKAKQARRRSQRCAEALDKALAAEELAQLELDRIESAFQGEMRGSSK